MVRKITLRLLTLLLLSNLIPSSTQAQTLFGKKIFQEEFQAPGHLMIFLEEAINGNGARGLLPLTHSCRVVLLCPLEVLTINLNSPLAAA